MSFHSLLQRIFPTRGLNPGLLYCRWILYPLSSQGSPLSLITASPNITMSPFHHRGGSPSLQPRDTEVKSLSRVQLLVTPWTVARQAPPSMGFSWQEYSSGLPFPSPERLNFYQGLDQRWPTPESPVPRTSLAQSRDKRVFESQHLITVVLWVPRCSKYCLRDRGAAAMPL